MRDWPTMIESGLLRSRVCQHRARRWIWYTKFAIVGSLFMAGIGLLVGWLWITAFYLLAMAVWARFLRSWRRSLTFWREIEASYIRDQERLANRYGDYLPGRAVHSA